MKILFKCCGKCGSRRALVSTDVSEPSASAFSLSLERDDAAGLEEPEGKQGKGLLPRTAASHNSPSGFPSSVS